MKEATETSEPVYYPSAHRMVTSSSNINASDNFSGSHKKPRMELELTHDQYMDTIVVNSQQQQSQHESPTQLKSIQCTVCKDSDDNTLFYRPAMALHTLFQAPKPCAPSSAAQDELPIRQSIDTTDTYIQDHNNQGIQQQRGVDHGEAPPPPRRNNDYADDTDDTNTISNNVGERTMGKDSQVNDDLDEEASPRLVIPKQHQPYATLYDATNHQPLWSLVEQDWHTITLLSRQQPHQYLLMTTSTFSFVWEGQTGPTVVEKDQQDAPIALFPYQWRMKMADDGKAMDLLCEQWQSDQTRKSVALLANQATRLVLFGSSDSSASPTSATSNDNPMAKMDSISSSASTGLDKNPFRLPLDNNKRKIDSLDTFLLLSGLLLHDLISSQLRALGGGLDAMVMMIERQQDALMEEMELFYKRHQGYSQQQTGRAMADNDGRGMIPTRHYTNQNISTGFDDGDDFDDGASSLDRNEAAHFPYGNNGNRTRWSSSASLKSLELDPGLWRCWWGYGCWWSWFPCCMPGGWCDRAWIKVRGGARRKQHHHRSRVTRRMQVMFMKTPFFLHNRLSSSPSLF